MPKIENLKKLNGCETAPATTVAEQTFETVHWDLYPELLICV